MVDVAGSLHRWGHEDYEVAKQHIWEQIGSLDGLEVFGRQVLVAVYTRPAYNARSGLTHTEKEQQKDWYEGKVVLVLACGPDAFTGDDTYVKAMYGGKAPPKPGDWLFQNANAGIQFSINNEGKRIKYTDRHDEVHPLYPGDGWPVRIVSDDGFLGRLVKPHTVV